MRKSMRTPLSLTLGTTFIAVMASSPVANADSNPFAMQEMESGYMQLAEGKCGEGKCGEGMMKSKEEKGRCGKADEKAKEMKCGEGKCGEGMMKMKEEKGRCGKADKKAKEMKCGEGKCGSM